MSVDIDDVLKAQFASESVWPTERFRREPRQVIDVMRAPLDEQRLQDRIRENFRVEQLLEAVKRFISARMFVQAPHVPLYSFRAVTRPSPSTTTSVKTPTA